MDANRLKIAITGASGFVGKNFLNRISDKLFQIVVIPGITIEKARLGDVNSNYFFDTNFGNLDIFLHLGWQGSTSNQRNDYEIQSLNIKRAEFIIQKLGEFNNSQLHFIGVGSQAEFGRTPAPWSDNSIPNPDCEYSKAKVRVQSLISRNFNEISWLRIFSAFGPNDQRQNVFRKCAEAIKYQREIKLESCHQKWSNLHINDVSDAILLVIENRLFGNINIADQGTLSLRKQIEIFCEGDLELINFSAEKSVTARDVYAFPGVLNKQGWKPKVDIVSGMKEYRKSLIESLSC